MNFVLRYLLNLAVIPLLHLSIALLPAEELNELFAACLIEFVYYSLTSRRIKMNFLLSFLLNLSITPLPAKVVIIIVALRGGPLIDSLRRPRCKSEP